MKSGGTQGSGTTKKLDKRSWRFSIALAAVIVGVSVAISATVNPLFGRYVHWDWMAGLAPTIFVLFTLSLRNRWI